MEADVFQVSVDFVCDLQDEKVDVWVTESSLVQCPTPTVSPSEWTDFRVCVCVCPGSLVSLHCPKPRVYIGD